MKKIMRLSLILTILIFVLPAFGQQNVAGLSGTVRDQSGAVVGGASITARSVDSGVEANATSGKDGVYTFTNLPIGTYVVTARAAGFAEGQLKNVRLIASQTATADIQLAVGNTSQVVTVTAQSSVDLEVSDTGQTRVTEEISALPLTISGGTRGALDFMKTEAGVQTNIGQPGIIQDERAVVQGVGDGGISHNATSYIIDGVSASQNLAQGPRDESGPIPDEIAEFRVSTNLNAEYGWNMGSSIELVSKSGTNRFHGSVFEYLRNDALDARNWFASHVTPEKQNEFGGVLGGPIIKDKLFFFTTYDGYRLATAAAGTTATVPTTQMAGGDFSQWLGPQIGTDALSRPVYQGEIYDPATTRPDGSGGFIRDPFPGNIIPTDRLSSLSLNLQKGYPAPTLPGISQNWVGVAAPSPDTIDKISEKIDYNWGNNRLSFGYKKELRDHEYYGGIFDPIISSTYIVFSHEWNTRLSYTRTITPNLLLSLRTGASRDPRIIGQYGLPSATYGAQAGLTGTYTPETPSVNIQNIASFGGPFLLLKDPSTGIPAYADLSYVRGRHAWKFGADYLNQTNPSIFQIGGSGTYNFSNAETGLPAFPGTTGVAYASFLLGNVDNATLSGSPYSPKYNSALWGFYVQDAWRATNKLTVNYGLRYDFEVPLEESRDAISSFDPSIPNPGAGGILGAVTFWGSGAGENGRHRIVNYYGKAFGPRLGLAYALDRKTVIRAYGGIIYGPITAFAGNGTDIPANYGFNASIAKVSPDSGVTPAFNWNNGWPGPLPTLPTTDPSVQNGGAVNYYDPVHDRRPLYAENLGFGVERELPGGVSLRAEYVGKLGHRIFMAVPINNLDPSYLSLGSLLLQSVYSPDAVAAGIQVPYPGFTGTVQQALLPYPQYPGGVSHAKDPAQNTAYHALEVNVQKHFGGGLSFLAAYTLSKNIGTAVGPYPTELIRVEQSLSRPQNLVLSYTYDLPFGPGKRFLNSGNVISRQVVGGWQVAGIQNYMSGLPINFSSPVDLTGQPIGQGGCGSVDPYSVTGGILNPAAFSVPAQFTIPTTTQLHGMRNCGYKNENIAFIKLFPIREGIRLNFGAEFFNIFNRHTWTAMNTSLTSATFGNYTGASDPRDVQFHLRLEF
jgi:Carboxypeptidase regulatory-like domain